MIEQPSAQTGAERPTPGRSHAFQVRDETKRSRLGGGGCSGSAANERTGERLTRDAAMGCLSRRQNAEYRG